MKNNILFVVCLIAALLGLWLISPYERSHYTCLRCRLEKRVVSYWGIPISIYRSNECYKWYITEHPDHTHDWKKSSCTYGRLLFSEYYACGRGHPIYRVVPDVQKVYLSTCTDQQAEEWFALLESKDKQDHEIALELVYQVMMDH
jgi:hypothetical protein